MDEILRITNDNAVATGNLCGISLVQVSARSKLPISKTRQILNQIIASKQARVREGIHGKLVFAV